PDAVHGAGGDRDDPGRCALPRGRRPPEGEQEGVRLPVAPSACGEDSGVPGGPHARPATERRGRLPSAPRPDRIALRHLRPYGPARLSPGPPKPSGAAEAVAMSITGHQDPSVFKRCNVRRDDVQADALARMEAYLASKRGTTPTPAPMTQREGTTTGHDGEERRATGRTQA